MAIQIPLVVVLWQHVNAQGVRRTVIWDTPDLRVQNFNDKTSSVHVHPGPDYEQWKAANGGTEPTASLYADINFAGAVLTLEKGYYPDIHSRFAFGDKTSSVRVPGETANVAEGTNAEAPPIANIPVVLEVFTDKDMKGTAAVVVENIGDLYTYLGEEFKDEITSIRAHDTRDGAGAVAALGEHENGGGRVIRVQAGNTYSNLVVSDFNDRASSVLVVDPPPGDLIKAD